jgi:hypothetical protein
LFFVWFWLGLFVLTKSFCHKETGAVVEIMLKLVCFLLINLKPTYGDLGVGGPLIRHFCEALDPRRARQPLVNAKAVSVSIIYLK